MPIRLEHAGDRAKLTRSSSFIPHDPVQATDAATAIAESKALRSELREGEVRVIAGLTLFLLD